MPKNNKFKKDNEHYDLLKNTVKRGNRGRPSKDQEIKNAVLRITEDKLSLNRMGIPSDVVLVSSADLANYICAKTNNLKDIVDGLIDEFNKENAGARTKTDIAKLLLDRAIGPQNKPVFEAGVSADGQIVVRWGAGNETPNGFSGSESEGEQPSECVSEIVED